MKNDKVKIDIVMPQLGESVAEGTILKWHKKVGDRVKKDEVIFEVSTDKIDTEIPAPEAGVLSEILVSEDKTVDVGTVVARIESEGSVSSQASKGKSNKNIESVKPDEPKPHMGGESGKQETRVITRSRSGSSPKPQAPKTTTHGGNGQGVIRREKTFLSPVVRKMMKIYQVGDQDLEKIPGSGAQGRITKRDMEGFLQNRSSSSKSTQATFQPVILLPPGKAIVDTQPVPGFAGDSVEKMSNMRKKISEHMTMSRQTSAHCQLFHEADVTDMMKYRTLHAGEFSKDGVKLTVTPLFLLPLMKALREFPIMNASVNKDEIIYHENINLGLAVSVDKGLIVPVIKNAENLNLLGLAKIVQDLATRARENKLTMDDLLGGTFTITNPGMYGTLLAAPIINQPQVAIFAPGAIQKRVVVRKDNSFAVRDMVYLSLSFDHRVIDGAVAGAFLKSLTHKLEQNFSYDL
jgi:pyruvate dehydrogenase complex dihydrolipoamide acetyltransferase long form